MSIIDFIGVTVGLGFVGICFVLILANVVRIAFSENDDETR